jgi:hypothetical protein
VSPSRLPLQITASLSWAKPPSPCLFSIQLSPSKHSSHGVGAPDRAAGGGGREARRAGRAPAADAVDCRADGAEGPGARGEGRHRRVTQGITNKALR